MSRPTTPSTPPKHTSTHKRIRSTTVPLHARDASSSPTTTKESKSHNRHHHFPRTHHKHKHSDPRNHEVPQSAIQLGQSSTGATFNGLTSPLSKSGSRLIGLASHITGVGNDGEEERDGSSGKDGGWPGRGRQGDVGGKKEIRQEDIIRERDRRIKDEGSLTATLSTLSQLSTATTRSLDYAYYSLLTTLTTLNTTLGDLSALSASTTALHTSFAAEISSLDNSTRAQIASFEASTCNTQQARLRDLEQRMRAAREKVGMLDERVEGVRGRIERWEGRAGEGERRTGRWIRGLWRVVGLGLGVLVLIAVLRMGGVVMMVKPEEEVGGRGMVAEVGGGRDETGMGNREWKGKRGNETERKMLRGGRLGVASRGPDGNEEGEARMKAKVEEVKDRNGDRAATAADGEGDDDPWLRIFDEL